MSRLWPAFLVLAGSASLAGGDPAPAPDGEPARDRGEALLRYTLDPAGPPFYTAGQRMTVSDTPPSGVKLPRINSRRPRYLSARLGMGANDTYYFVVDESSQASGYDLLYADGNHNGDLTDDRPARSTRWSSGRGFKPVRLLVEFGGRRVQYHVAVQDLENRRGPEYRLLGWGYYSGEARFGEKSFAVAVVDYNANGRFDDLFRGYADGERGDVVLVDANGDGKFDPYEFAGAEVLYCARYVRVDGRYYALAVRPDGTGLAAAPALGKLATLRSGYERFALLLGSEGGMLALRSQSGTAEVPPGDYRILGWQIEQRAADGSVWMAQGMAGRDGGWAPPLTVKGDAALPRLASPLVAKLTAQRLGGREVQFSLDFAAASGEAVTNVLRDGRQIPEPRLKIRDARGREVAELTFHYG